jgi:hypothetical protein
VNLDANAAKHRAARAATCLATEPAATPANGTAAASKKRHATNGDRWAMLNAFVDVIAPRLTLVERAVWLVMFRHTRGGTCDTSERAIATQARIDKASAGKALRRLVELGLAWPVFKSNSKGTSSRYGLHPRPDACVAAVIAADDARRKEAQERREERGGDRRGKRRKPR